MVYTSTGWQKFKLRLEIEYKIKAEIISISCSYSTLINSDSVFTKFYMFVLKSGEHI